MASRSTLFPPALHAGERVHQVTWAQARAIQAFPQTKHGWQLRGWPDRLTPGMIAALLEPRDDEKRYAIWNALLQECSNLTLNFVAPDSLRNVGGEFYTTHSLLGDGTEFSEEVLPLVRKAFGNMRPVPDEMLPHMHRLSFTTVGEWLSDTGRVPSAHIAAWFAACGFVAPGGLPAETEEVAEHSVEAAPQVKVHSNKGKRTNMLTPVIEDAVKACNSTDVARVWMMLIESVGDRGGPFVGLDKGKGLKYFDPEKDGAQYLSRKQLGDRLARLRTLAKAR